MCMCGIHSQIKPKIYISGYNYEKINNMHIICSLNDFISNTTYLFNSVNKQLDGIQHINIFCWYDLYKISESSFLTIFESDKFKNIQHTIHNIIYDDIEYTYDMAKNLQPTIPTLSIIEEPWKDEYKKPYYDDYIKFTFPSRLQMEYLNRKFGNIYHNFTNIEEIKSYIFPKSSYIPSKDFIPFDWKKYHEEQIKSYK